MKSKPTYILYTLNLYEQEGMYNKLIKCMPITAIELKTMKVIYGDMRHYEIFSYLRPTATNKRLVHPNFLRDDMANVLDNLYPLWRTQPVLLAVYYI